MARRTGPDEAYRLVYLQSGVARAQGLTASMYADEAATTAADVLTEAGGTLPVSGNARTILVDADSKIPRLQYPDGTPYGSNVIYCSVNGGPVVPLYADLDQREDLIENVAAAAAPLTRIAPLGGLAMVLADATRSCALPGRGDSTGNETTEWVYLFAQQLATAYPAWTVQYKLWNDATQDFDAPTVLQTGAAGLRYLDCDSGTAGLRLEPAASPHVSGVIDVRVKARASDWTPSAVSGVSHLVVKGSASPVISWRFGVSNSGVLYFYHSTNGTGLNPVAVSTVGTGFTDGTTNWIRCVFTPDDGGGNRTAKFYTGSDGVTWSQLGTTVTTSGAVTVFNETSMGYQLGGLDTSVSVGFDIFEVQIRNGDGGPNVVPALPDSWGVYGGVTTNAQMFGAPVLTIVNGSHPGAGISYLGDATRLPKMTPDYGQVAAFLSSSHNDARAMGAQWITAYAAWVTTLRTRIPHGAVIALTQNPELSTSINCLMHTRRRFDLIAWGRTANVYVLDTYGAFLADGRDLATVLLADTIHPSAIGSTVWANAVKAEFDRST